MMLLRDWFVTKAIFFCFIQAKAMAEIVLPRGGGEPRFLSAGSNVTVVEGRDVTLACAVEDLGHYKVAWLRVDTQTILTIGPHVITKNHRVGVGRGEAHAWALTIRETRPKDEGRYMCQINTEPMITQTHYLEVLVPPDIMESGSGELLSQEGDAIALHCQASGRPRPAVTWRRKDSLPLVNVGGITVSKWSGEWMNLTSLRREQSGVYLCIATNGVPPSVSKRIVLHVLCKPSVWMTAKSLGAYLGEPVKLECRVEAYPVPVIHWSHIQRARLKNGSKYQASITSQGYQHTATLKISGMTRSDMGSYYCHAENSLGTARDDVTVYTLATTAVPTIVTTTTLTHDYQTTIRVDLIADNMTDKQINSKKPEEDSYAVVISQHRMQIPDLSPSK